jgi:predicted outer membrane repeat protein
MRHTTLPGVTALATILVNGVSAVPAVAGGSGIPVPCDTAALINAIAMAPAGSTLVLARRCTYQLTTAYSGDDGLPLIDRQLTIEGRGSTIVRDGVTAGAFRIFHVTSTGDLRLDDVTIRGGSAPVDGGGILVDGSGTLKLSWAVLDNNTAGSAGGGVSVEPGATAYITRSEFTFNNADLTGGGLQSDGTVTTDDVVFDRNNAASYGGAIDHEHGDTVHRNTTLKNNTSGADGGGIDLDGGTAKFINSKILNNTTTGSQGGGIWNQTSLTLIKTEVSGNVAGGSNGQGGGIYQEGSGTLVLRDSSVDRNSANGFGTSRGGGIYNTSGAVTLDRSEVNNNASTTAPAGVWTDTQFTVNRSEIRHNIPTNCDGSPVIVTGCVG